MGKPQKASKQGRPSKYTQELADKICELMATGESLRAVCAEIGFPESTVREWAIKDVGGFSAQYTRARELQAESLVDQIVQIADGSENDFTVTDDGKQIVNQEVVARARLRVDARKWVASKILPKVYGDKVDTNITGTMKFELSAPWLERIVQERGLI